MMETARLKDQLYLAAVIALLLFTSMLNGYAAVAIAVFLFVVGLVIYPEMRRTAIVAGVVALGVAAFAAAIRALI